MSEKEATEAKNSLSFTCDRCSKCCKEHRVPLTRADVWRVVAHHPSLKEAASDWMECLDPKEVDVLGEPESLLHLREGRRLLALSHNSSGGGCVFLNESGCSVHAARPSSCRAYPFESRSPRNLTLHPEVMCPPETHVQRTADADPSSDPVSGAYRTWISARDRETSEHAEWVQRWNRRQKSRLRLGKLPQAKDELLRSLLSAAGPQETSQAK